MSRKKLGSSFIVDTTPRFVVGRRASLTEDSVLAGREAGRAEPAARARVVFFRDEAALARAD
jgi:hypothetical protein